MTYVMVFLAALVTGALVYWLTLRAGRIEPADAPSDGGGGFLPDPPDTPGGYSYATSYAAAAPDGRTYVPIGVDRRSWQTRTVGVLGLLISVTLGAALLAFSLYQCGSLIAKLINDYAS
jgi:hypothetical protein